MKTFTNQYRRADEIEGVGGDQVTEGEEANHEDTGRDGDQEGVEGFSNQGAVGKSIVEHQHQADGRQDL